MGLKTSVKNRSACEVRNHHWNGVKWHVPMGLNSVMEPVMNNSWADLCCWSASHSTSPGGSPVRRCPPDCGGPWGVGRWLRGGVGSGTQSGSWGRSEVPSSPHCTGSLLLLAETGWEGGRLKFCPTSCVFPPVTLPSLAHERVSRQTVSYFLGGKSLPPPSLHTPPSPGQLQIWTFLATPG